MLRVSAVQPETAAPLVCLTWLADGTPLPDEEHELLREAKDAARGTTGTEAVPPVQFPAVRSTTLNLARSHRPIEKALPDKVGKHSKRIDKALPGKHTKELYDSLTRREAAVLVQLRTGMARLNSYLDRIRAARSEQCACGRAAETTEHFHMREMDSTAADSTTSSEH
jgi:hypothetical protein